MSVVSEYLSYVKAQHDAKLERNRSVKDASNMTDAEAYSAIMRDETIVRPAVIEEKHCETCSLRKWGEMHNQEWWHGECPYECDGCDSTEELEDK